MAPIESLSLYAIELSHAPGEVRVRRFDEQLIVVGHQAVGMHQPVEPPAGRCKNREEGPAILVTPVDILLPITAGGDVVKRPREFQSKWSRHTKRLDDLRQNTRSGLLFFVLTFWLTRAGRCLASFGV